MCVSGMVFFFLISPFFPPQGTIKEIHLLLTILFMSVPNLSGKLGIQQWL